jgi:Tol biopolymer transport system component
LVALMVAAPSAQAAFPGANGKIAFVRGGDIWTMNPDGSGQTNLTNSAETEFAPAWSPDGAKIAFGGSASGLSMMNADGGNRHTIPQPSSTQGISAVTWSPDGQQIAYTGCCPSDFALIVMNTDGSGSHEAAGSEKGVDTPDWSPDGSRIAVTVFDHCNLEGYLELTNPDGSNHADLVGGDCIDDDQSALSPSWSPNGQRVAYENDCLIGCAALSGIWTVKRDGTDQQQLTASPDSDHGQVDESPAYSPDGTKIAFTRVARIQVMNADGSGITDLTDGTDPDWQPIPINTYPRPKGATPLRVPLVPANKPCAAPNSTHGAPLSYDSCAPPQLTSGQLTTGTPDSNGLPVRMEASLLLRVVLGDVKIDAHLNDVFKKDLSDYSGALRASLPLRITDKDNTPSPGGPGAGTTVPFQYGFDIPCTPDPATDIGSDCSISTTANTLVPGTIKESLRTIWQVGRVRVDDAGPVGNPDTAADNTVFAVQGVFVP